MAMYDGEYLAHARALCTRYSVHIIAEEIMTGFGRTGTTFAWEQSGAAAPDFLTLSKGITGGYLPLSCVLTSDEIYAAFYADDTAKAFLHSHSYTGNALACRAALEVLAIFRDDDVLMRNRAAATCWAVLATPLREHPMVRNFRQCGMILAFEVTSTRPDFARWFFAQALRQELLLRPIGHTVYFMPPYTLVGTEFTHLVAGTLAVLDDA